MNHNYDTDLPAEKKGGRQARVVLPPAYDVAARLLNGEALTDLAVEFGETTGAIGRRLNKAGYGVTGETLAAPKPTVPTTGFMFAEQPWMADSACLNHDPEMWFSSRPAEQAEAKAICASCPVRLRCLAYALDTEAHTYGLPEGIWGGETAYSRGKLLATRKRDVA